MTEPCPAADRVRGEHSQHPAVRHDDRMLTYAALDEASARVATLLIDQKENTT